MQASGYQGRGEAQRNRDVIRYFGFLAGLLVPIAAALVGFTFYERTALGVIRLGTGDPPMFTPYYLARLLVVGLLGLLLVAGLYRLRQAEAPLQASALSRPQRIATYAMVVFTALLVAVFIADPSLFARLAREDGPVEWPSALLPLASSLAFAFAFFRVLRSPRRDPGCRLALALSAFFAVALFVIGMEEISWMQRVFDVPTPALFAGNEQQETNLHNMYNSLVFNIVYRTGVFTGLIVLPFIVETAPSTSLTAALGDFLPGRFVLAMSAPLVGFDYNSWNFFLGPLLLVVALLILGCYTRAASRRGDHAEVRLFTILIGFVLLSQGAFFAAPEAFAPLTWTISEYRELLLATGLAVFTWEVTTRLRVRYAPPKPPYLAGTLEDTTGMLSAKH
jgi:hypothetical protein